MPNVNALKKFVKKKIKRSSLANNKTKNEKKSIKQRALNNINGLTIKSTNEKFLAEQKLYNQLMKYNNQLTNNIVFSPVVQRLLNVKPIPKSAKKSIKKSSPKTSGRTARRKEKEAEVVAAGIVLSRKGIPTGPGQIIFRHLRLR